MLLLPYGLVSQSSKEAIYLETIHQSIERGTFKGFACSQAIKSSTISRSRSSTCAEAFNRGYGTNCWNDTNTAPDPACVVPTVPAPSCNGGRYRIPIAITIFECANWTGANYLSMDGETTGGFEALPDTDLTNKLIEVNELYANANIEFYELQRRRIEDCNLYDFFNNVDPATGVNELDATAVFDVPNAINIYFVGGIDRDHDCCGTIGFAPYPLSRDYILLRYGAGVLGSNLAHELGHYFGLPHTYATSNVGATPDTDGVPVGSLDNCDCLTTGDGICDTWPDPSFSHNCNHDGGTGGACYIRIGAEDFCDFDEVGYRNHILTSHPGAPTDLLISPNSGVDFSATSSTILKQNIMTNNLFFGCTTTFTPCQYRKIHDVARAACRDYLCTITTSDYFSSTTLNTPNSAFYEICAGDPIPTFNAGQTITRFDGTTYDLSCFNWFEGEFDAIDQALLATSSSYTPPVALLGNYTPGVYEFWVAEANALNDIPCKVMVSITVSEGAGVATVNGLNEPITTCDSTALNIEAFGSTINPTSDMIGWYFSVDDPVSTLTTATEITTAINNATNSSTLNAASGNIIQSTSGDTLNTLEDLIVDCKALGAGNNTYYLTPFVANGEDAINCSTSQNSTPIIWNFLGNTSNGSILNIGPFEDCNTGGTLADFSITFSITDCSAEGSLVGTNISINCGSEISFNSAFDFMFTCGENTLTITKEQIEALDADFDPSIDQVCFSFIDAIFGPPAFEGDLTLSITAKMEATYQNSTAQNLWDAVGRPTVDTTNPACFWGTPLVINCDCPLSDCPSFGTISGNTNICLGSQDEVITINGIENIGESIIQLVYYNEQQTGAGAYGKPEGILGSIPSDLLTNNGTEAILEEVFYPEVAGTYFVYAIVSPTPTEESCRPFLELPITVHTIPTVPIVVDTTYCQGNTASALTAQGENLLWYEAALGGIGTATAPIPNTATPDTQRYWVAQTINGCESGRARITIAVNEIPTVPVASDTIYCLNEVANALAAQGENSERTPIVVIVNDIPDGPIVTDTVYCQNDAMIRVTAIGENLLWYETATGGMGSATTPILNTTIAGTQFYWVTQTTNGCESERVRMVITIQPAITLSMNTFENPTTCNLSAGIYESITVTDGICTSLSVTQELSDPSIADVSNLEVVGGVSEICAGDSVSIRANIVGGQSPYTIELFDGAANRIIHDYMDGDSIQGMPINTTTYSVIAIMDANNCTNIATADPITITIHPIPTIPVVTDTSYCQNEVITALTAVGDNLLWYETETGGMGDLEAPIPNTTIAGTQIFWVSQMLNGCESERVSISVIIEELSNRPIVEDISYCQNEEAVALTAIGTNLLWYEAATGGIGTDIAPIPSTSAVGIQTYWVRFLYGKLLR